MNEAEEKARELYPDWKAHSKKIDSLGVIVVMAERQAFLKGYEYANQQPEVDHECKYCGAMTTEPDEYCYRNPNSKDKQPEQGEVDNTLNYDLELKIKKGDTVLWHFDDTTRSRFVEVKGVNYTDKSKPIGVWLGGGWVPFDMIEKLPNDKVRKAVTEVLEELDEIKCFDDVSYQKKKTIKAKLEQALNPKK